MMMVKSRHAQIGIINKQTNRYIHLSVILVMVLDLDRAYDLRLVF